MKEHILVAGGSGALGLETLRLPREQDYQCRALVFSSEGAVKVSEYTRDIWKADASEGENSIEGITSGISIVISALGKSVSLFTNKGNSFMESDFYANKNILEDAKKNGVERFIYTSIKGADEAEEFEVARAHKKFEEALQHSGLDYTIIRPVGFFSGLHDLAIMAKRKIIPIVGDGHHRTNSIHQKDLAAVLLQYLREGPEIVEVGGPVIHTRLEMAEMIQKKLGGKIVKVPEKLAELGMILPEIIHENTSDKLKYFKYVTTRDMVGAPHGDITFQQYLEDLDPKNLP